MSESQLQRELDRRNQFLELVLETGRMNGAFVDTDLRHTWVHNDAPEPPDEDILGQTDSDLFSEEMAKPTREVKRAAMQTGSRVEREFTFNKPHGQNRYRAAAEPLRDADGAVTGAMFAAIDLSDRYRLLDRTSDAVYTVDGDWTVTFWNERMAQRTGVQPEDVVGKTIWDVFGDDIPEELEARYRRVMADGEPAEFEQYVPEPLDYWVEVRAFADEDGLTVYSRDVTERRERRDRLTEQRDDLDVLNEVLRHDIRNDLQVVLAYADRLRDAVDDDHEALVETLLESAMHAVDLTTTARQISEVVLSAEDRVERVDLSPVLEREVESVRSAYPDAAVTLDDRLPEATVVADDMLASVFRNLLKNAIQHNDSDVPEVSLTVESAADDITVRVADNGPGIPEARREAVFGRGETGLGSGGTGMGLYLVQRLVGEYGGRVWIESNEPRGAVFAVALPRVTQE
ncbi:PAS domain S-box [Halosimplex carlsbadense 2-9-1]|uniref:histidine kinase n=1 Tax=Halosimplex carlsbadense 2-9-1 TaxID=797114 RepID=M0CTD3_9EURY|nr:PAS domain-containing protein [Halosimplex carlsbadense]ELZ25672.1 PAS domain S-box [Halosimplex carlsbadense 2-9-1]